MKDDSSEDDGFLDGEDSGSEHDRDSDPDSEAGAIQKPEQPSVPMPETPL